MPVRPRKYGLVTTGNEVFYGRIQDTFTPVVEAKLAELGCEMAEHVVLNDDHEKITAAIKKMLDDGCEMVFCSGGMSVDPDDKTPLAIKNTGAKIVSYGAPVLQGNVSCILLPGRSADLRSARLRNVRKADDIRPRSAVSRNGYARDGKVAVGTGQRRLVP